MAFTADKPELFEGWHNPHLLIVLDECKGIPDPIYRASLRCQPERLLLLSSPGGCNGFFYDAFHKNRRFFKTHAVTAFDAPHISREWIEEIVTEFGESHPYTRSAVFGEFMSLSYENPIPLLLVEQCLANPPAFTKGDTKAFLDFAAGSAENVLALRRGNRVEIAAAWRESDTAKAIGKFMGLFKHHQLELGEIMGDADGLGVVFCDLLAENGWAIDRFHGGQPARKSDVYNNRSSELWHEARRMIESRQIILPNDQTLIGQLSSRKGWIDSKGRLCLESKDDMKKRGLASPDRADAVLGALLGALPGLQPAKFEFETVRVRPRWFEGKDAWAGCLDHSNKGRGLWY